MASHILLILYPCIENENRRGSERKVEKYPKKKAEQALKQKLRTKVEECPKKKVEQALKQKLRKKVDECPKKKVKKAYMPTKNEGKMIKERRVSSFHYFAVFFNISVTMA